MFFTRHHFTAHGIDPDTADLVAKISNGLIDSDGQVVTGEFLQDGSSHNFGSEQKRTDTHVAVLLGVSLMGTLKPHASPVALEKVTKEDHERALAERVKDLERENKLLREKR